MRHHNQLLRCGAVLSAPPHDVRLSAKVQWEYRSTDVSVLVVGACEEEDDYAQLIHPHPAGAAPFDTLFQKG